ncbi:gamma-glutamyltransferase [Melioribacteraceae bacterium 09-Me]|uniref:Glutathione hydrolase proenzyme n=2 Tax=Stygiobacter electus TaxID=3032292 RepID=A0AAE3P1H0_9BACT|nr:gamma-glutamyltransferase [Stygiobacter electus]MDF1611065.1 gamma-glutamyltransferase [Stygiobacter electus]
MKKYFILVLIFISINNVVLLAQYPLTARAKNGMVVSANQLASEVGIQILKKGGNAIDAAVATGFALAVTYPFAGNIGGGGFMVIQFENGKNTAIDFREKAPLTAHRDMYLDEKGNYIPSLSQEGATSVAVPGSVAGLIYALEKYGTKSLSEVIQPAIELAKKGWKLDYRTAQSFNANKKEFEKYSSSKKIFVKDKPWKEGDLFVQKDLAKTLEVIKKNGKSGFYKGKVADLLINQINSLGGKISQKDLDLYNVVEKEPVKGTYKGYEILSMPPSSSGGIALIEILNILENFKIDKDEWGSSEYIHKLVEAMKYAYADRAEYLGDDKFYSVPQKILTSKEYAKIISEKIKQNFGKAVPSNEIDRSILKNFKESNETTHYSVIDKYGNAVSVTTTINSAYGSKIVVEDAGFLLNNEMDDFSAKPGEANQFGLVGNEANSIQPQKRPLSSMTPTIVLKNGKPYIVIGSPGGSRIITTVLQVILNCLEFYMNIADAINSPRIHHQWLPDKIYIEQFALSNDVMKRLMEMGYQFENANNKFTILGLAEGILVDQNKNIFNGAADKRGAGAAIGY